MFDIATQAGLTPAIGLLMWARILLTCVWQHWMFHVSNTWYAVESLGIVQGWSRLRNVEPKMIEAIIERAATQSLV